MPALSAAQMQKISNNKKAQRRALEHLINEPFDLNNATQMALFQERVQQFELSVNRMYVFEAMTDLIKVWGSSWIWAILLPIPESINIVLNYAFYVGIAGWVLSRFNSNDFHQEWENMKEIYNWALKGSSRYYDENYDNAEILKDATVQKMITLLAPLCSVQEMIAWKLTGDSPVSQSWKVIQAVQWTASWLSGAPAAAASEDIKVQMLKEKVEREEFRAAPIDKLKQALEYFSTNPDFRGNASEKVLSLAQQPFSLFKTTFPNFADQAEVKPTMQ